MLKDSYLIVRKNGGRIGGSSIIGMTISAALVLVAFVYEFIWIITTTEPLLNPWFATKFGMYTVILAGVFMILSMVGIVITVMIAIYLEQRSYSPDI